MSLLVNLEPVHEPLAAMIAEQLEQVALIVERQLASDMPAVNTLCLHVERYRGKMLRPSLVLASGIAAGTNGSELTERHRVVAAVTEIIHLATLVHDDVLDEADLRRRSATINHLWGTETAVILGDYLISNAFHLCSTLGNPSINLALGEVTNTVCEGEVVQLARRNDHTLDEATYVEIVRRKTASLIGACCRLGAELSGAHRDITNALRQYGVALGIAFQIQDDLLDLVGEEQVVGKSVGRDLDQGTLTLPMIYCLSQGTESARHETMRLISNGNGKELRQALSESDALGRARETAQGFISQAHEHLETIPASPARDLLAALADAVLARRW